MKIRTPNKNEQGLLYILACDQSEITKHTECIYSWRGIVYEVVTLEQMKRRKIPASWYSALILPGGEELRIREMGNKAQKVIDLKKKGKL